MTYYSSNSAKGLFLIFSKSTFKLLLIFFIVLLSLLPSKAQVFKSLGSAIKDFDSVEKADTFAIPVSGLPSQIDKNYGISKVCINLTHERVSDLKVELLSPDGTKIWLTNRNGGVEGKNYINTCFRSNGFKGYIYNAKAPFLGEFIPDGRIEFLNNGQNPNGTWKVLVWDLKKQMTGSLNEIYLYFEENPTPNFFKSPCSVDSSKNCFTDNPEGLLLPDLVLVESITKNSITVFEKNDKEYPSQIRFAASIANLGHGPVEIYGKKEWYCGDVIVKDSSIVCSNGQNAKQKIYQKIYKKEEGSPKLNYIEREAGFNYFDTKPGHSHFHVDDWVEFSLVKRKYKKNKIKRNKVVCKASKVSFCLFDSGSCNNSDSLCNNNGKIYGEKTLPNYGLGTYNSCNAQMQGISVGGYDTYGYLYEGQFLTLPPNIKPGIYYLIVTIDPKKLYKELDKNNNTYTFKVKI